MSEVVPNIFVFLLVLQTPPKIAFNVHSSFRKCLVAIVDVIKCLSNCPFRRIKQRLPS